MHEEVHPLRKWRREQRVTATALGERVGVVASQITQIETGGRVPSLKLADRLVKETGLPFEAFVRVGAAA